MSPRICYLGNFRSPESTERHWKFAFEQLGCEVRCVQQDEVDERAWERAASSSDLALWSTTWGWPLPGNADTWRRISARGVRTASLHLDLLIGLDREQLIDPDYSHPQFYGPAQVWTSDGSHDDVWRSFGIDHRWLPPAIHAPNAILGTPRDEYACDVVFTGSVRGYHREHMRRRELVAGAIARYGTRFRYYGPDDGTTIRGPELADVYASARVVLGDSLCLGGVADRYLSDRVPECAGRGAVLVHPWNVASPTFDECAIWSGTWDVADQLDLVDEVLAWPDHQIEAQRERAHRSAVVKHTYTERARMILAANGLCVDCDDEEGEEAA